MQETESEAKQSLSAHFNAVQNIQKYFPATRSLAKHICTLVDSFARDKGRATHEVDFEEITWDDQGQVTAPIRLKDPYALSSYKPTKKAWHEYSNLKDLDAEFPQVVSLMFALGTQLAPICKFGGIRADKVTFEKVRYTEADGRALIRFKMLFEDDGKSTKTFGQRPVSPDL